MLAISLGACVCAYLFRCLCVCVCVFVSLFVCVFVFGLVYKLFLYLPNQLTKLNNFFQVFILP